jgi:hypothetical protein
MVEKVALGLAEPFDVTEIDSKVLEYQGMLLQDAQRYDALYRRASTMAEREAQSREQEALLPRILSTTTAIQTMSMLKDALQEIDNLKKQLASAKKEKPKKHNAHASAAAPAGQKSAAAQSATTGAPGGPAVD